MFVVDSVIVSKFSSCFNSSRVIYFNYLFGANRYLTFGVCLSPSDDSYLIVSDLLSELRFAY